MTTIGSLEAKKNLSQILDRVRQGEEFVITSHGKAVAQLVPVPIKDERLQREQAIARIKSLRDSRAPLGRKEVREMIEEGRR